MTISTAQADVDLAALRIQPERVQLNTISLTHARTWTAVFAGVAAGILGLTSLAGLVFFLVGAFIANTLAASTAAGGVDICFPEGRKSLFTFAGMFQGLFPYILVWTVVYDAIYIF